MKPAHGPVPPPADGRPHEHTAPGPADRPNTWQHRARVRLYTLWYELDATCADRDEEECLDGVSRSELRRGARCLLTHAERLINAAGEKDRTVLQRVRSWWHGELYEGSLGCVHQAEVFLTALTEPGQARARVGGVLALARQLCKGDPRLTRVEELQAATGDEADAMLPAALAALLKAAYAVDEERGVRNRNFRNRLVRAGIALLALLGATLGVAFAVRDAIPVCGPAACLAGGRTGGTEVGLVMLVGMLGAGLPVVGRLQQMSGSWNAYNLTRYQELVKLPVGSLTAVAGLVLVDTVWLPMLNAPESWKGVMAYALVFGITQLAFTRSIDKRAEKLLAAEPDREEAKQLENVPTPR